MSEAPTEERAIMLGNDMAYPVLDRDQTPNGTYQLGVTKRELFAAMAMQGIAPQYVQGGDFMETHVAEGAVKLADALLKELAK
jgi:hypothetical protein